MTIAVTTRTRAQKEARRSVEMVEAVCDDNVAKVNQLLNVDPALRYSHTPEGESMVILAACYGARNVLEALLKADDALSIHEAAALGQLDHINTILLFSPSSACLVDRAGWTALHLAGYFGHLSVAATLLEAGADLNFVSRNALQQTPLHSAVVGIQPGVVRLLLRHGAYPNARASGGWTPLHLAAHEGAEEIAEALIERGADVNATRDDGATPFMAALLAGRRPVLRLLHSCGARRWGGVIS